MKTFLKPTLLKVSLALVLFVITSWLWRMFTRATIMDLDLWGFPLAFFTAWGPCPPDEMCSESNALYLVLDIVFWYLISALGNWLIQRKKS